MVLPMYDVCVSVGCSPWSCAVVGHRAHHGCDYKYTSCGCEWHQLERWTGSSVMGSDLGHGTDSSTIVAHRTCMYRLVFIVAIRWHGLVRHLPSISRRVSPRCSTLAAAHLFIFVYVYLSATPLCAVCCVTGNSIWTWVSSPRVASGLSHRHATGTHVIAASSIVFVTSHDYSRTMVSSMICPPCRAIHSRVSCRAHAMPCPNSVLPVSYS